MLKIYGYMMMEEGRGGSPCVSPGHAEFSEGTPTTAAVFGVALESHLLKQLTGGGGLYNDM